jgi:hypothetical protein
VVKYLSKKLLRKRNNFHHPIEKISSDRGLTHL